MPLETQRSIFRADAKQPILTEKERESLLKPYLPKSRSEQQKARQLRKTQPVQTFLTSAFHFLIFSIIHILFSIYARVRKYWHAITRRISAILYYHHRTPELIRKDVKGLSRLPEHLSIILELPKREKKSDALEQLLDNVAEVSAWCACVGIPLLSVYEKTGILKSYIPTTHKTVSAKFFSYFGANRPVLRVRAPHMPSFLNGDISEDAGVADQQSNGLGQLNLLLLSADDGRNTLLDLTKTLAEMAQHNKLSPADISPQLIDAELVQSVMGEPDLLIIFGPEIKLNGYPPWQIRLTEIFHESDNTEVEYLVWLKGLHRFARAEMRFGR